MKKVIMATLLAFVLVLTACGNRPEANSPGEPIDLSGNWVQEGKEFDESYKAGYISGDRIEIFWMADGGESRSLYWSGTYEAPQEETKEYSWNSKNDKTRTDSALLASTSDQKTFTYKNGKISYEASLMGETAKVTLVRTETDYMGASGGAESADTTSLKEVELMDSGYSIGQSNGRTTVFYAVEISNPNQEYAIMFPKIAITAKDAEGKILKTEEMVLSGIAAGDDYIYGNFISYEGVAPETVDIAAGNSDNDYVAQSSSSVVASSDLLISNISDNPGMFKTFTGEVTNNSGEDISTVAITVIYKSGDRIIGGETSYVDDLKSGETKPFEVSSYSDLKDYDSYEIYGLQW